MTDATAESFLAGFIREFKSAEVAGIGTIYYFEPPSVAEKNAYNQHVKFNEDGLTISRDAIIDGIIARVKTADKKPMFFQHHRSRFFEMPDERLIAIWHAIGAEESLNPLRASAVEDAEKK